MSTVNAGAWGSADPALQEQVRERQRITITNYTNDPALLEEHVGMEDNFQAGGYGERQVEELLQNAIDQLGEPGRVELRLSNGNLYCANEGNPFAAEGIRAVTGAFLSSKRDEKIGRFGLGFKSVLGVTDNPQILSRSISFGFNESEAAGLLSGLPYQPARIPSLRVPSLIDAEAIAADDPNVADMMAWASTIIRLRLARGADRLRRRLVTFDPRYLLFPDNLAGVTITVGSGDERVQAEFRRHVDPTTGFVHLDEGKDKTIYRVLHREHDVSARVKADLPGLFHREKVRVSYALPVGQGRRGDGEFWAWFPLRDKTTAQGIFNAPWQVNDDRTSMLPGSALNQELLDVAADLLIDPAVLESTPEDPAKHFDVLPARGRETRSAADKYMSERVPRLARMHELIPTAKGEMRSPARVRVPYYLNVSKERTYAFPAEAIRAWSEATGADDTPHWSCYQNATRAARLTQLLTDENDRLSATPISPVDWLTQAAKPKTLASVGAALGILEMLAREKGTDVVDQFRGAKVIPLADGEFGTVNDVTKFLLPLPDAPAPGGVSLIADQFSRDPVVRRKLAGLGIKDVSADQVAAAVAASIGSAASDDDWAHLWSVLASASHGSGAAAITGISDRGLAVRVPTRAGTWKPATQVFLDAAVVPKLPDWQVDIAAVGGRTDLLQTAGCLAGPTDRWPVHTGEVFAEYSQAMQLEAEKAISGNYGHTGKPTLRFDVREGPGPIDVLKALADLGDPATDDARAKLTSQLIKLTISPRLSANIDLRGGRRLKGTFDSIERWGVDKYGLIDTTQGPKRPKAALSPHLEDYGEYLPVARESFAGQYALPTEIERVGASALRAFMTREGYRPTRPELLGEVLAVAALKDSFADADVVPALVIATRQVALTPLNRVVVAADDELGDLASHGLHYIPSGPWNDALRKAWGILAVEDVIARVVDWVVSSDPVPVLDIYPSLVRSVSSREAVDDALVARCSSIVRRTTSPTGVEEKRLNGHLDGRIALVDDELSDVDTLLQVSALLRLRLTRSDAEGVLRNDEKLRTNQLVQRVQAAQTPPAKILMLVGRDVLAANLPQGLLSVIEERQGRQSDDAVADLFITTYGNDALRRLKGEIANTGIPVPRRWDGTSEAEQFVTRLGLPRSFAGTREKKPPAIDIVPGKVELKELHDFQKNLLQQIRHLVLNQERDGNFQRGLLYLPTGAGKTRVTTQTIATMLRDNDLTSPVLWIAQSEELCEQAIVSWTEVWRALGDERPLEITRYWGDYEADESLQELQVVIATDAKLGQMIASESNKQAHRWLRDSHLVVIDEAHRAGSQRYTQILDWLGISQRGVTRTERPLLGLTATPYRGTNERVNDLFAQRFGKRLLNSLDEDDPIGQLRRMRVLSRVEHQLLDSNVVISDSPTEGRTGAAWDDVSRAILDQLGANLDRTQLLVDHVLRQDPDWPILIFTPSVVAAHVTAALIRSLGRTAEAVDGGMRGQERRRKIDGFKSGETKVLVNCDLLTQGFDAPKVRALYIARPTFSPNRYVQMVGRGLRGHLNGGTDECLVVNVVDTFEHFDKELAYTEFHYLWTTTGA